MLAFNNNSLLTFDTVLLQFRWNFQIPGSFVCGSRCQTSYLISVERLDLHNTNKFIEFCIVIMHIWRYGEYFKNIYSRDVQTFWGKAKTLIAGFIFVGHSNTNYDKYYP